MARCGPSFVRARERSIRTTHRKNAATKVGCRAVLSLLDNKKSACFGIGSKDVVGDVIWMMRGEKGRVNGSNIIKSDASAAKRLSELKPDQWITTKGEPVTTLNAQKEPRMTMVLTKDRSKQR